MLSNYPHNEKDLLFRISQGDEAAFKQLFDDYWENIYSVAYLMTRSRETSRDIVQEVFIKLWLLREELSNKSNFRNFLFIVARNHIIDELRKTKNDKKLTGQLIAYFNDRDHGTDQQILYNESADRKGIWQICNSGRNRAQKSLHNIGPFGRDYTQNLSVLYYVTPCLQASFCGKIWKVVWENRAAMFPGRSLAI